jgi:hypothetical protein
MTGLASGQPATRPGSLAGFDRTGGVKWPDLAVDPGRPDRECSTSATTGPTCAPSARGGSTRPGSWGSCQARRCRTGAGATFPAGTGAAGTTTTASHLRPGTRGSLIFHRSGLTGGPAAAGRGEGSRRRSQAPAGQATTHLASPEPAPCCRGRPPRTPRSAPFGGDSVRSKPTSITAGVRARRPRPAGQPRCVVSLRRTAMSGHVGRLAGT